MGVLINSILYLKYKRSKIYFMCPQQTTKSKKLLPKAGEPNSCLKANIAHPWTSTELGNVIWAVSVLQLIHLPFHNKQQTSISHSLKYIIRRIKVKF